MAFQEAGYKSIMVNSNPETVSTDFDTWTGFTLKRWMKKACSDILENETSNGNGASNAPPSIVQFGGQTAINLSQPL